MPPRRRFIALCAALPLGLLACSPEPSPPPEWRVDLDQARQLLEQGRVRVFDIREHDEHATGVAPGMTLLPLSALDKRMGEIPQDPAQPVLIICNTQNRSSKVVQALREAGWRNVRYVHGGMSGWSQRGWPLVKP